MKTDTITAQITPPGRGGVGIIRVSGPKTVHIAKKILHTIPPPRYALHTSFYDAAAEVIDSGLALFFQAPHSFTGEDILEMQGHGGSVVMDMLLKTTLQYGARMARPGEFSERAFLNGKLDLAQAEAIADLIDAASEQAAKSAVRSLQGVFSQRIQQLVAALTQLRVYVEAAIDFPQEEIDFLSDKQITRQLKAIQTNLASIRQAAQQGSILREGMTIVIAGKPNAGKSSLLNTLAGRESAIVTDVAGTTRDVLREYIQIDGVPLHVIDTAGLRETQDVIEQEGVKRAYDAMHKADQILLVVDQQDAHALDTIRQQWLQDLPDHIPVTVIINKIDLCSNDQPRLVAPDKNHPSERHIYLSAKTGMGLDVLRQSLLDTIGFQTATSGGIIARRRHLDAIDRASECVNSGAQQLKDQQAGELLAEELRRAQNALSEITGTVTSDDLLGHIFSSFCVGK